MNTDTQLATLLDGLTIGTAKIPQIMQVLAAGRYVFIQNMGYDKWFQFIDHKYQRTTDLSGLSQLINEDIKNIYLAQLNTLDAKAAEKLMRLLAEFEAKSFHITRIKEFSGLVYDENFLAKLDANPRLLCCENGVIDLKNGHFRPGQPQDYCSLSTGLNYAPLNIPLHTQLENRMELHTLLNKMCQEKELFLQCAADIIFGNLNKKLYIFEGSQKSAHTIIVKLIAVTMGQYFNYLPEVRIHMDDEHIMKNKRVGCFNNLETKDITLTQLRKINDKPYLSLIVVDSIPDCLAAFPAEYKIISHPDIFSNEEEKIQMAQKIISYAPVMLSLLVQLFYL